MSIKKKEIELLNILLIELFSLFTGLNNNKTNEDIETIIYNYDSVRLMATNVEKIDIPNLISTLLVLSVIFWFFLEK